MVAVYGVRASSVASRGFFFVNDTAPTEIYTYCHTLSLHDAVPILFFRGIPAATRSLMAARCEEFVTFGIGKSQVPLDSVTATVVSGSSSSPASRSEEHTSELQSLLRISYAVFCLQNKNPMKGHHKTQIGQKSQHTDLPTYEI